MASNAERQAAFKERMRGEGKVMKTWWVGVDQERAIKAYLAGQTLPVTARHDQESNTRVAELENEIALLTQRLADAQDLEQKANQECINLRELHQVVANDMQRLNKELKVKKGGMGFNLSAPRAEVRAKVLLAKIDQMTTWQGETKSRDADGTRHAAERMATLVRQTKAARTAIAKAEQELDDVMADGEKEVLTYARQALSQLLDAAEIAKDRGREIAKKREDHVQACEAAAHQAIAEVFKPESIEDQIVLVMAPGKPESYTDAADLLNGKAFERSTWRDGFGKEHHVDILARTLANAVKDAINGLVGAVDLAIKEPADALAKAQVLHREIELKRPALLVEHENLIRRIKSELVLRQLEKAAAPQGEAKVC